MDIATGTVRSIRVAFCGALLALPSLAAAQSGVKAWQQDGQIVRRAGSATLSMEKDGARNAPPGSFYASAINMQTGMRAEFRGACAPVLAYTLYATDTRKVNLAPFLASNAGRDIPAQDVMQLLREGLAEQCEALQVLRIRFVAASAAQGTFDYQGTALRSASWRLQDGRIATPFDGALVFEIRFRDLQTPAVINFRGGCAAQPRLLLEPQFASETERVAYSEVPDNPLRVRPLQLADYVYVATSASERYARECPGVKRIEFAINPMPSSALCRQGTECFLVTTFDKAWTFDASQFKAKEYNRPIRGSSDMFEVLAAGRFDIAEDYRPFFSYFVISYLTAYAEHCAAHIKNPVSRRLQFVERTRNGNGDVIREDRGDPIDITMERDHGPEFDRHLAGWQNWSLSSSMSILQRGNAANADPVQTGLDIVGTQVDLMNEMTANVRGKCMDDRTMTMQRNMVAFSRGQPPETGRFTTTKQPLTRYPPNGSSAPEFTKAYLARREQESAAIQQARQDEFEARQAARTAAPARGAGASAATSPASPATPPARNNAALVQELTQAYAREMADASRELQEKVRAARTPAERTELQRAFQEWQRQKREEMQARIREASGR